jgi:prophage antirepressor-like protein
MNILWFNAKDITTFLGYKYTKNAIVNNIENEDKIKLENININYKVKKHPHSVYINKNGGKYYTYYNDENNDKYDTEIQCFPSVFNPNITEDLKPKFSPYYTCVKK